jgi:hypothetical protein
MIEGVRRGVSAALPAAILSGIPSTAYALVKGQDPLEATEAAGSLVLSNGSSRSSLLIAGAVAHLAISAFWGTVLTAALPRRNTAMWGALAGVGIALLDLGVIGGRNERIRSLSTGPQVADHIAFGAITGVQLARLRGLERS